MLSKSIAITAIVAAIALHTESAAAEYGWPVKPFHEQHAIRGNFCDPRIAKWVETFHFGVDVYAPNGTAVYATQSGVATIMPRHGKTVVVTAPSGRVFQYWHIAPTIRSGQWVTAYRTVVGHIEYPWAHVHFTEVLGGQIVNPLRPGALTPYADSVPPVFVSMRLERSGEPVSPNPLRGSVDIVANIFDAPPIKPATPWREAVVAPALIQWRVRNKDGVVRRWASAVDFRRVRPSNSLFRWVYAARTIQNRALRSGRYRFYVAHRWDTTRLHDGDYVVQVIAVDHRANANVFSYPVTIDNH
ncbi:MAG: M23 family metallopeptidase [Gaiellaceae bacterium]